MSDEQILPCVVCNQQHEQMLMLVCMHDPCINCAATHYCTSQTSSSSTYICSKCGEVTDLDASSVVQLERVYSGLKAKRKYDYRRGQGSIIDVQKGSEVSVRTRKVKAQTQSQYSPSPAPYQPPYQPPTYTPISQPSYPTAPYNNIQLRKSNEPLYICQTHPQQQLSYFCFNCNCPICPECAIHGVHREHEVQTTRKAIKNIKNNLQKCSDGVVGEINNLNGVAEMYRNRLKDSSNQCKKDKDIVKESFGQLRAILMEKEKQFYKNIDTISENNTGIYRNETSVYDKLIDSHQICKKNIEQTLKKDDLAILQEYNKREKQANSSIESSKNKKYNPDLDGLKQIDYGMFRDQMEQLMGIVGAMKLTIQGRRKN